MGCVRLEYETKGYTQNRIQDPQINQIVAILNVCVSKLVCVQLASALHYPATQ